MPPKKRGPKAATAGASKEDGGAKTQGKRPRKETGEKSTDGVAERGSLTSNEPVILFAHGAGANSTHEWMVRWKKLLATTTNAVEVITFDYPYLQGTMKKAPPKAEKLVDGHVDQTLKAREKYPGHPLVLVGKSMGSRVGCMVAGQDGTNVAAVVCLGYPLKGFNGQLRDQTLLDLKAPVLFVQGTKDSMCPLDKLAEVRKKLSVDNELYTVDGGDHGLKVGMAALKRSSLTQAESDKNAANAIDIFLKKILSSRA